MTFEIDTDRQNENDQIYEPAPPTPTADIDEIREYLQRLHQWVRTREPVGAGNIYPKFLTYGAAKRIGLLQFNEDGEPEPKDPDSDGSGAEETIVEVYARDMRPTITGGASSLQNIEISALKPNLRSIDFDPTTQEAADFEILMPEGWVGGAFSFRVYWSHAAGASAYGVVWQLGMHSVSDNESIAIDLNGGNLVKDTGGAANRLYITSETTAIPITGVYCAPGDLVFARISRVPSLADDTLDIDARLHAIKFSLAKVAVVDDEPPEDRVLLIHGDTDVADYSAYNHPVSATGTAASSTTVPLFGGGMLYLDGAGSYLTIPDSAVFSLGLADWLIDFQLYVGSTTGSGRVLMAHGTNGGGWAWVLYYASTGRLDFYHTSDGSSPLGGAFRSLPVPLNTMTHCHIARTGGTMRIGIAGGEDANQPTTATLFNPSAGLGIGAWNDGTVSVLTPLYMGEISIIRGPHWVPEHGTFTPPVGRF